MIHGLNFNGTHIPDTLGRRFAKRIRIKSAHYVHCSDGNKYVPPMYATLSGVATTQEESNAMQIIAENGTRRTRVVERKSKLGALGTIYGVYTYHG